MAKTKKAKRPTKHNALVHHRPRGVSPKEFEKIHWPYLPILMVAFILLAFGIQSGVLQAAAANPTGNVLSYSTSMSRSGLLTYTNKARNSNGVASLKTNSKLAAAAQAKAVDMANKNYWSHYTPSGNPPWIFVTAQGYAYQKLGENLAAGFADENSTINGWMASPPHRENLLDSKFTEVGFGFANNPNYTSAGGGPMTIVVAFYGQPAVLASTTKSTTPTKVNSQTVTPTRKIAAVKPTSKTTVASNTKNNARPTNSVDIDPLLQQQNLPATTDTPKSGITLAVKTSGAELAFAKLPLANWASGVITFLAIAAFGLWISRHLLSVKRMVFEGEAFIIRHPLIDVGLVLIVALALLLSRTAGLVL